MTPANGDRAGNGSHPADPAAARVTALARELERAVRRLAGLEELTGQLDTLLRQLAADVTLLAPGPDEEDEVVPPPVRS